MLGISVATVKTYIDDGFLTAIRPRGKGPGKPVYIDPREVELYANDQLDELRAYQATKRGSSPVGTAVGSTVGSSVGAQGEN